jgi:hypothetical protein
LYSTAEQLQVLDTDEFDRKQRIMNDTITWVAETLNGSMRTTFEYRFDGQELYGEDGGAVTEIFDKAIVAAELIVNQKPNLLFELRRRLIERGELDDMLAMARGDLPNTMITVSDFPPELTDTPEDIGGYNATRKQTMLRSITKQADGSLRMTTQSLDGSNRRALEVIYRALGEVPDDGELLGQRMHKDMNPSEQAQHIDQLTRVYDASLEQQFGGSWHAGIRQRKDMKHVNTFDFASSQHDLIGWYATLKLDNSEAAESRRYDLAATMSARYERWLRESNLQTEDTTSQLKGGSTAESNPTLLAEIMNSSYEAAARGQTFNGCGETAAKELSTLESQLKEAGFGNQTDAKETYDFHKLTYCRGCQKSPKPKEGKKMCGPCDLCRSCDRKYAATS